MTYQNRVYLHSLGSAALSGGASAVILVVADPLKFNLFDGGALKLLTTTILFAVLGIANYLKEHPLPDPDKDNNYQSVVNAKITELKETDK